MIAKVPHLLTVETLQDPVEEKQ